MGDPVIDALAVVRAEKQKRRQTLSAAAVAQVPFKEIMKIAREAPLAITRGNKTVAFLISPQLHQALLTIKEASDRLKSANADGA